MLFPNIKSAWSQLLLSEPVLSPLGRPDTLVYLMDMTLAQLLASAEGAGPAWLEHCAPVVGSVHRHCACGLNPLLKYFATGELALRAGAGVEIGEAIEAIITRFRQLAQHEIGALCAVCRHPPVIGCPPTPGA